MSEMTWNCQNDRLNAPNFLTHYRMISKTNSFGFRSDTNGFGTGDWSHSHPPTLPSTLPSTHPPTRLWNNFGELHSIERVTDWRLSLYSVVITGWNGWGKLDKFSNEQIPINTDTGASSFVTRLRGDLRQPSIRPWTFLTNRVSTGVREIKEKSR